jgi:restriction system protein
MASFTEAAYTILKAEGKPLTSQEITKRALEQKLIISQGKTPERTMWSSMFLENKRRLKRNQLPRFKQLPMSKRGSGGFLWELIEQ